MKRVVQRIMLAFFFLDLIAILHVQAQPDGFLRLVDRIGNTGGSSGRLEIFYDGRWGTICDDIFGEVEARVACQQLGYTDFSSFDNAAALSYPRGSRIWLDGIRCTGLEPRLASCSLLQDYGEHNCFNSEDIILFCFSTPVEGAVRLVDSSTDIGDLNDGVSEGRLEVYFSGQWGGVCENDFGSDEATVACRQLGYNGYTRAGPATELGYLSGFTSVLNDVDCSSSEYRLTDCSYSALQQQSCAVIGSSNVGIICTNQSGSSSAGLSAGVVVGIVVAALAVFFILALIFGGHRRHRRRYVARQPAPAVINVNTTQVRTTVVAVKSERNAAPSTHQQQQSYPAQPLTQYPPGQEPPPQYSSGYSPHPPAHYPPGQGAAQYPPGQVAAQYPPGQVAAQYPPGQGAPAQYPPSNYAAPYPSAQQPPAPYPAASQQPPPDYSSQPAAYPAQLPYPSS